MTVAEAAAYLGRPVRTVNYWITAGYLNARRAGKSLWLIREADVHRMQAAPPPRGYPKGRARKPAPDARPAP